MRRNSAIDVGAGRAVPVAARAISASNGVILLVEDHPTLRDTLALALGRAGYQVHSAGSAGEAVDCWQGHASDVDLLIVDCGLGYTSGRVLASELRHERSELRVLYVSGSLDRLPGPTLIGPNEACLAKPFASSELLRAIDSLLHTSN